MYLLNVFRRKMEFPELKRMVRELATQWRATVVLVEDKSSGTQLIQELRADGFSRRFLPVEAAAERVVIPVMDVLPPRVRKRVAGLHGIVDDDHISAAPGQHAANGRREPVTALGGLELGGGVAV